MLSEYYANKETGWGSTLTGVIVCVWLILFVLFLMITPSVWAEEECEEEPALSLSILYASYADQTLTPAPVLKLQYDSDWWHLWSSYEQPSIKFGGQECCDAKVLGAGVGVHRDFGNLRVGLDVGYYYPFISLNGSKEHPSAFWEAMSIYTNREVYPYERLYKDYNYQMEPNFGGAINLGYKREFTEHFSMSLLTGYRALKMNGIGFGYHEWTGKSGHWEIPVERDFSGFQFGFKATWEW